MFAYITNREITKQDCPDLPKSIPSGTPVYSNNGISVDGKRLVSFDQKEPYFELPKDALTFDLHNSD